MKSIIFNTEMVKAILDGRKTQFRKVIKDNCLIDSLLKNGGEKTYDAFVRFSKFQVCDILYVKETFVNCLMDVAKTILFKADGHTELDGSELKEIPWESSLHLKQKDARIFLKVTNVRVERLQDIGYDEINLEGFDATYKDCSGLHYEERRFDWWINLWNKTAQKGYKWEDNPYVFVYEFERVEV